VTRLPGLVLVGAVRGPVEEAVAVRKELERVDPAEVHLDISPEELWGLKEYFSAPYSEPLAPLLEAESALARALSDFGEVRMPSPSYVVAIQWAHAKGRGIRALDPDEDAYSAMFLKNVRYLDLVRRTRAEHALSRSPPQAGSAEEVLLAWDARVHRGKGSQRLATERNHLMAERLREIAARGEGPVSVAIVDVEHWASLVASLEPRK
jgi:hypothetical protein